MTLISIKTSYRFFDPFLKHYNNQSYVSGLLFMKWNLKNVVFIFSTTVFLNLSTVKNENNKIYRINYYVILGKVPPPSIKKEEKKSGPAVNNFSEVNTRPQV